MHIVFINQFMWPDCAATAQHLSDVCLELARRGHAVRVIASRAVYAPAAASGASAPPQRERWRGIEIERVGADGASSNGRGIARLAASLRFLAQAGFALARSAKPDLVVSLTSPPLAGLLGHAAKRLRGALQAEWVMDLYPQVAVALGALAERSPLTLLLRGVARVALSSADAVFVLGADMRAQAVAAGACPGRVHITPCWADGEAIAPRPSSTSKLRRRLGIADDCVVIGYAGNFGRAHNLEAIAAGIRALPPGAPWALLLIGGGPRHAAFVAACRAAWGRRVYVEPYQARERLGDALAAADIHLIGQSPHVDGLLVPSKLYGVMAAGRPSVLVGSERSAAASVLRRGRCGEVVSGDDPAEIGRRLSHLVAAREQRRTLGARARALFEAEFEMRRGVQRLADRMEALPRCLPKQRRERQTGQPGRPTAGALRERASARGAA